MTYSDEVVERVRSIRWHHDFEVLPGLQTNGTYKPGGLLKRLNLPDDMSGRRVMDIGARDGFFSFECEKRGADVLAVDYVAPTGTGFQVAKELRNSRVEYLHANLYDLKSADVPSGFDMVLFLGVVYHLPDPYLALEIVRHFSAPNGVVYVESTCSDAEIMTSAGSRDLSHLNQIPIMVFSARNETSFWDPNGACLKALCEHVGLNVVRSEYWGKRQLVETRAISNRQITRVAKNARGVVDNG